MNVRSVKMYGVAGAFRDIAVCCCCCYSINNRTRLPLDVDTVTKKQGLNDGPALAVG